MSRLRKRAREMGRGPPAVASTGGGTPARVHRKSREVRGLVYSTEGIMKGTALTAFLPNLTGFTSPRGLRSSRVQEVASRASSCIGEQEGAGRQSDRRTPSSTQRRAGVSRASGRGLTVPATPRQLEPPPQPPPPPHEEDDPPHEEEDPQPPPDEPPSPDHQLLWPWPPRRRDEPRPGDDRTILVRKYAATKSRITTKTNPMSATSLTPRSSRGSGIPASRVKGKCPQAARPKAHLRKSRGCPQDDDHEHTREQRPPLPEPPPGGLRHDDLRGDVGAGHAHRFDQPRPGLPRHRRPGADRRGGLPRGPHGTRQPVPAGPGRTGTAHRDRRAPAALLRARPRPRHRGPRHGGRHGGHRRRPPRPPGTGRRGHRPGAVLRLVRGLHRHGRARYASPSPCARTPEPSPSTWTNCAPPSPRAPACCS